MDKAYTYEELDEAAKAQAREWYANTIENVAAESSWSESVLEHVVEVGKALNIAIDKRGTVPAISFDLNPIDCAIEGRWSSTGFDPQKAPKEYPDPEIAKIAATLKAVVQEAGEDGAYVDCSNPRGCNLSLRSNSEEAEEAIREFCGWAASSINREWEWLHSPEKRAEEIELGGYKFTEDGEPHDGLEEERGMAR